VNRQYKRLQAKAEAQKQKGGGRAAAMQKAAAAPKKQRTKPRQFFREVVAELRKVAWPTRQEVVAYSIVVLVSCVFIATLVFGMDYVFTKAVLKLFGVET
jgi:preprotein translocase subunit SecE